MAILSHLWWNEREKERREEYQYFKCDKNKWKTNQTSNKPSTSDKKSRLQFACVPFIAARMSIFHY